MSKTEKTDPKFTVKHPILKDVTYEIVHAQLHDNERRVASFSMKVHHSSGICLEAINKMSLLEVTRSDSNEKGLELGSMGEDNTRKDGTYGRLYAITFFPNRKQNEKAEKAYRDFVSSIADAVSAFVKHHQEINEQRYEHRQRAAPNPLADQLRQLNTGRNAAPRQSNRSTEVANSSD